MTAEKTNVEDKRRGKNKIIEKEQTEKRRGEMLQDGGGKERRKEKRRREKRGDGMKGLNTRGEGEEQRR